jgi:hypothetical protein
MKKIISLVLATSLLVLFGCTKNQPISDVTTTDIQDTITWQTYEATSHEFTLQYPDTRTFEENVYGSLVMFLSPLGEGDTLKENVGIAKKELERSYSLDDYSTLHHQQNIIKIFPDYTEVSNETITINNIEAKKIIYTLTQGDTKLQQETIYIIKDKIVYIITYTALQSTFDEFAQTIDEMISTFEIQ